MSPGSEQAVPQQPSTDRSASAGPDTAALRFRQDLTITQKPRGAQGKMFVVKDPRSGEHYEFDEHAFFLCQSFDGVSTPEQIVTRFNSFFGESITTEDVARFFQQALEMGLLESTGRPGRRTLPVARGDRRSAEALTDAEREDGGEADSFEDTGGKDDKYRWTLTNPSRVYALLNRITKPFRLFFLFLTYGLFVGIPLALITFLDNQYAMSQDLSQLGEPRSYLGRLVFSLLLINFGRCVVQGTVCTYYGGTVRKFGIKLRFGIIPRFFIDKSAIKKFDRNAKLWTYGSNLLFRLVLVVIGVFTWYLFRGTGTQLAVSAIIVAHAALISFILVCLPIRASDGYRWLVTFFRLPLSLIKLAIRTLVATVTRKPLPTSISDKERRRLLSYSLVLVSFWTYAFFRISSHITAGLASSFPDIFGQATEFLIGAVVVVLVLKWGFHRFSKMGATGEPSPSTSMVADDTYTGGPLTQYDATRELWQNRALKIALKIAVVVTIGVVLALPYPYRPGGEISLLPPEQQQIQAPISGKISEVLYNGGDGRIIPAEAVVATMVSTDLENLILTLKEQIAEQEAERQKRHALLEKLLAGARPEEVDQARAREAEAAEQVKLAERQLAIARVTSSYSDTEVEQIQRLPEGLISQLDVARAKKQADVDRLKIGEQESNLAAKRQSLEQARAELALLLSGVTDQDIEATRQDLAAAEAELRRLRQELSYAQSQSHATRLQMPFEGFLVDSYLRQKTGTYLSRGETFVTAQVHRNPMVEMILPEYDVGELQVGSSAEIKLMAYPTHPMHGEVVAIEPAGSETLFGHAFRVVIQLSDVENLLKTGMSGYGKVEVGSKPLFVLLTRPLVRFAQIEMWSWIP